MENRDLSPYSVGLAEDELGHIPYGEAGYWTLTVASQSLALAILCCMGTNSMTIQVSTEFDCDTWAVTRYAYDKDLKKFVETRLENPGA